jgi:hypothetical protein
LIIRPFLFSERGGMAMADKKNKRTRQRPSKGEEFEVKHLTETTDLSPNQARDLLRKHGNDWRKIEEEAKNYKAEG